MNGGIIFLLLVCFYWGHQVISNVVHVTVAGTVGTWWFNPVLANSCCSSGVTSSFKRATTFSFGSICLGSLIVAIVNAVRSMVRMMRNSDDGIVICIADCILGCIEGENRVRARGAKGQNRVQRCYYTNVLASLFLRRQLSWSTSTAGPSST